ncbi:MAG: hypothetical protein HYW81_03500, partial [Parcubacteria group bacterium]|nr:hypothetical protein [Parcubacteria group bacterium]
GIGFLPSLKPQGTLKASQVHQFALPQYTALFFNQAANPVLKEREVRLALALATSRQDIIDGAFGGDAAPVDSPILPGMLGYSESIPRTLFDPAQAEKLLDDAGWKRTYPEGADGETGTEATSPTRGSASLGLPEAAPRRYTREKNGTALSLELLTIQREESITVAEAIRDMWQRVGVTVNLNIVDLAKIQKDIIKPRTYEVLLFGQIIGKDPDPYPFWHSSQANDPGLNLALYQNKATDALLEDARKTSEGAEREKKYVAFQQQLAADVPALFLYSLRYTYLTPERIKGISTERINHPSDRFSNVNTWYIKTKKRLQF